jgi:hypothetical protein
MWPEKIQRQFDIALARGNDALENVMHAPYNKLLNTLFPVDTDFTVIPNFQEINSNKGADYLVTFEVFLENKPVFVLQLKREKDLGLKSKRTAADDQLRARLGDLIGKKLFLSSGNCAIYLRFAIEYCPLDVLRGVSAFGTKLCFYSITKEGLVWPKHIPSSALYVSDTAPIERWNFDILTAEGEGELRRIVQGIFEQCAQLEA